MKRKRFGRLLSLLTSVCLLLTLLPAGALADNDGSGGIEIDNTTQDGAVFTFGPSGKATWDEDSATLLFEGEGTISVSDKNKSAVHVVGILAGTIKLAAGANITLEAAGNAITAVFTSRSLTIEIGQGATLNASCQTGAAGALIGASGLTVRIHEAGTLKATGSSPNKSFYVSALNSNQALTIANDGLLIAAGDRGLYAGGDISISGSGMTFVSGKTSYGILSISGQIAVTESVRGMAAGKDGAFYSAHQFSNNSAAFATVDNASDELLKVLAELDAGTLPDYASGIDVRNARAAVYSGSGGPAVWQSGTLTLTNAELASGGIKLPAGQSTIALQGTNTVEGGVSLESGDGNALSLSGTGSLTVKSGGDNPPFTGVGEVALGAPETGCFATAERVTTVQRIGIPGTPLTENVAGSYYPQPDDREFNLNYRTRAGEHLLIVERGFGGTIILNSVVCLIIFDDGGDFYGWEFYDKDSGESLGTDLAQATIADAGQKTAAVSLRTVDQDYYVRAITEEPPAAPSGSSSPSTYTVVYKANHENAPKDIRDSGHRSGANVEIKPGDVFAAPEGKAFAGWAESADGAVKYRGGETMKMPSKTLNLYAVWRETAPGLNKADHIAYVSGYPDGTVRPDSYITREETAMLFYRLLSDDTRALYETDTHAFPDVAHSRWSNAAIATLANAGILKGDPDGTFRPEAHITRAEFAAIAARFDSDEYQGGDLFPDIVGHWAAAEINRAAQKGWVEGDPGGLFRPNDPITRAEAVTLVNRVLERAPETADDLLDGMKTFSDNADTNKWYYLALQEAATAHDYKRKGDSVHEKWTALK